MIEEEKEHPFYGYEILREREQIKIQKILNQFKEEPVTEELKKRIWDALQQAKQKGDDIIILCLCLALGHCYVYCVWSNVKTYKCFSFV